MATNIRRPLVGLLDSAELDADRFASCLAAAELHDWSGIHHQERRDEWLAGRMAAKFVFLHRQEPGTSSETAELSLQRITSGTLDGFTPRAYREVVVTKHKSPGGGAAQVGLHAGGAALNVAISHVNGLACAFIGNTEVYSVDLEARTARVAEFYVHNFTPRERNWTGDCARSFNLNSDWLYTLLWSAKECLLKTPRFAALSLWDMPSIDINILQGSERLKTVHDAAGFSGDFELLRAEVAPGAHSQGRCPRGCFQLAVSGTADLVLTAITKLD
jgi:hypothetical protein